MATGVQVWSATAGTNATVDTNINFAEGQAPSSLNDSCRAAMASVANWRDDNSGALVTSGTSSIFTVTSNQVSAAFTTGYTITVQFHVAPNAGASLQVDGNAAKNLQVVPGTNIAGTEYNAGHIAKFYASSSATAWLATNYVSPPVTDLPLAGTILTKSTTSSFAITTSSAAFTSWTTGPSVAQGTTGVWFAWGQVTINSASGANWEAVLTDGATIISGGQNTPAAATNSDQISLSGSITNPAGNIRIVVRSNGAATLQATSSLAQSTGNNLSTVTVMRVG